MSKTSKKKSLSKAYLSWTKTDFHMNGEEPPEVISGDTTEGEAMSSYEVENWCAEEIKSLSILKEEFPEKFGGQFQQFILDLDYLLSLGKITKEECEDLKKKDIFYFGKETETE